MFVLQACVLEGHSLDKSKGQKYLQNKKAINPRFNSPQKSIKNTPQMTKSMFKPWLNAH